MSLKFCDSDIFELFCHSLEKKAKEEGIPLYHMEKEFSDFLHKYDFFYAQHFEINTNLVVCVDRATQCILIYDNKTQEDIDSQLNLNFGVTKFFQKNYSHHIEQQVFLYQPFEHSDVHYDGGYWAYVCNLLDPNEITYVTPEELLLRSSSSCRYFHGVDRLARIVHTIDSRKLKQIDWLKILLPEDTDHSLSSQPSKGALATSYSPPEQQFYDHQKPEWMPKKTPLLKQ